MITIDDPPQWGVVLLYDGEILGNSHVLYSNPTAAQARAAELRRRYPRHEIRLVRREVVWVEEMPA